MKSEPPRIYSKKTARTPETREITDFLANRPDDGRTLLVLDVPADDASRDAFAHLRHEFGSAILALEMALGMMSEDLEPDDHWQKKKLGQLMDNLELIKSVRQSWLDPLFQHIKQEQGD